MHCFIEESSVYHVTPYGDGFPIAVEVGDASTLHVFALPDLRRYQAPASLRQRKRPTAETFISDMHGRFFEPLRISLINHSYSFYVLFLWRETTFFSCDFSENRQFGNICTPDRENHVKLVRRSSLC